MENPAPSNAPHTFHMTGYFARMNRLYCGLPSALTQLLKVEVPDPGYSDHTPVLFELSFLQQAKRGGSAYYRLPSSILDHEGFKEELDDFLAPYQATSLLELEEGWEGLKTSFTKLGKAHVKAM